MKKAGMIVAVAAFGVAGLADAADLNDIYRAALRADAKLAAAAMQREAGREKKPQARAGLLPTLTLNGTGTYNNNSSSLPVDRKYGYNSNTYTLQLTQPLFRAQNWIAYKQGDLQGGLAEAQYVSAQMDLMQRTAQAYFDLLNSQDVLKSVKTLKAAYAEQLQFAKKSFRVGTVNVTDVNDAQARFDLAAAQEIAAQTDVEVKREAIRVLTGEEPPEIVPLRDKVTLAMPDPVDAESWAKAAARDNADVQAQQLTRDIAKLEVGRARAGHLPTVDAIASYGSSHLGATNTSVTEYKYREWAVGVQVSMPIFQGGGTVSKVRESRALADKADDDLEYVKRAAAQLARQSFLGVTSGMAQIRGYEAAVASTISSVDSNKVGNRVGVKMVIDILNAQAQQADATQKLSKARYDTIMSLVKLKQAVGSLSEHDLEEINGMLAR